MMDEDRDADVGWLDTARELSYPLTDPPHNNFISLEQFIHFGVLRFDHCNDCNPLVLH